MPLDYFSRTIVYLDRIGVADIVIPFLLVFTIVFMALEKANVFGSGETRKYSGIVALVLSLGVVMTHVTQNFRWTRGVDAVAIINNAIPRVSVVLVAIVFFLIMIGTFGYQPKEGGSAFSGIVGFLAIIAVGYIFLASAGFFPRGPGTYLYRLGPEVVAAIVVLLIMGFIIMMIMKKDDDSTKFSQSFGNVLKGMFKGSK